MSHFEMSSKALIHLTLAGLIAIAPAISKAAISPQYFPACYEMPIRTPASISRAAIAVATPSKIFYGENGQSISPELIANFNQIRAHDKPLDVAQLIPMDMKPTDNSGTVFSQIADKSLSTFFNSPTVRESSLGQTATVVEKKMKAEVVLGGEDSKSTQHKLNFSLQAFQALAQINYTGFMNAALKYKATENKFAFEIFEKLSQNKDFVVSHTVASSDQVSEVSLRWSF